MKQSCVLAVVVACLAAPAFGQKIPAETTGTPRFDEAIARGIDYIKAGLPNRGFDYKLPKAALAGYTCIKAGVSKKDPELKKIADEIKKHVQNGVFHPGFGAGSKLPLEYVYDSGVFAMFLAAQDPDGNLPALKAIAKFLADEQGADGSWDYPQRSTGDTSQNQYGVLGLWACMRAGAKVSPQVWDKCLQWHVNKKSRDGGWAYHPGNQAGPGNGASTHNMTFGATGTMAICRLILYPEYAPGGKKRKKKKKKLFGVLEETEVISSAASEKINPYANYKPAVQIARVDAAINGGVNWLDTRFELQNPFVGNEMYFYYAMERSMAMNDTKKLGGQDWYQACGYKLLEIQKENGSWFPEPSKGPVGTCFGVLFLLRSTKKIVDAAYGTGIQMGKRGFDLDADPLADAKKKKKLGPLPEMLARLDQMNLENVKGVPEEDLTALVEKILQTPRKELAKQIPLLKKLKDYPRGDVRSIVMFGLGRSGDMRVAPILIDAFNDNDVGVLSEAHTALCYISRKPRGFGIVNDLASEVEGLPQDEVDKIVNKWRKTAQNRWRAWYKRIRPYDERGDLWEISGGSASGEK
ncbi:MAG: hypothetical protein AB8G99_13310 [Planctomycetaceae bacterium]